ncbi:HMG box domain-containing protein [Aphelenchoides besseyi]|nr:HMG box domain-containing protein [Aphelenchoides besseyi]
MAKGVSKKGKDPNAPKRPRSPFAMWIILTQPVLYKPGMPPGESVNSVYEEFNRLPDRDKWERVADEDAERYEREMTVDLI